MCDVLKELGFAATSPSLGSSSSTCPPPPTPDPPDLPPDAVVVETVNADDDDDLSIASLISQHSVSSAGSTIADHPAQDDDATPRTGPRAALILMILLSLRS
jgi:hypothetical protein